MRPLFPLSHPLLLRDARPYNYSELAHIQPFSLSKEVIQSEISRYSGFIPPFELRFVTLDNPASFI